MVIWDNTISKIFIEVLISLELLKTIKLIVTKNLFTIIRFEAKQQPVQPFKFLAIYLLNIVYQ